ncbi:MAG: glycogen synthase [Ignavibacteriae bacterium]|nr:glycogen synthase [Ignavibacteriota bacterium]
MKICFVSSESDPFVKTGGLADVSGSLPAALEKSGCEVALFVPFYDLIDSGKFAIKPVISIRNINVKIGNKEVLFSLYTAKLPGTRVDVYFIDCPGYFHRKKVYTNDADEDERFILFQNAVLVSLMQLNLAPDIIHCNDWQTALIPAYLKKNFNNDFFRNTVSIFSIHNIAYQGLFDKSSYFKTNLPADDFQPMGHYELYDKFCFVKAGISFAEIVTTVSPTYAEEIRTDEFGCGLEGVLESRKNDLYGIINGINDRLWNPSLDKLIFKNYTFKTFGEKIKNKKELLKNSKLEFSENTPLLGIVSRFAWQKGFELFEPIMEKLAEKNLQIIALGEGEKKYEDYFRNISDKYPGKVKTFVEYNNELAHKITAASDIFLMPSKYEPCGLNQMYSLQYGTVPVVRKTGGLADTVKDIEEYPDEGNGFTFSGFDSKQFYSAIERALTCFKDKSLWMKIVKQGMKEDFSWNSSASKYIEIYQKALSKLIF